MIQMRKRLGELLIEAKLIDEIQLRSALNYQQQWGGRLGQILIKLGMISEPRLLAFLVRQFRIPTVDFRRIVISPEILKIVPVHVAERLHVIPLFLEKEGGKENLYVAMTNPTDLEALDELKFLAGRTIKPVVASDQGLSDAINYYYHHRGVIAFEPTAKPSQEMSGEDLIRITREFIRSVQEEKSQHRLETAEPMRDEDQVIVVDGKGVKEFRLTEGERTIPDLTPSPQGATGGSPASLNAERVLRALVDLLIAKGVITKEEIRNKLKELKP